MHRHARTLQPRLFGGIVGPQTHLDRLMGRGVIQWFPVDLADTSADGLIRAIMMIEVQGNLAGQVAARLRFQG